MHLWKSYMCSNKLDVQETNCCSHSSTESEIISLNAVLRLDGLPALELWDLIVSVMGNMTQTTERTERPVIIDRSEKSQGKINELNNIDCVPSNVQSSHQEALLNVSEDNEAVIKMIIERQKSYNETCFQDPQSCARLVFRSNQFGPKNSKSSTSTPKTNSLTS